MIVQLNKNIILEEMGKISIFKNIKEYLKNSMKSLKNIIGLRDSQLNILVNKVKNKTIQEAYIPSPSKIISGTTNVTDTCFTSIMKLIHREDLLKKSNSSGAKFLEMYTKIADLIPITKDNVTSLKRGHIVLFWYQPDGSYKNNMNDGFDEKIGLYNAGGASRSTAHFGIIIDPKKYLVLHMTFKTRDYDGDTMGPGSQLELIINSHKRLFTPNPKSPSYVLDMKVIDKM